MKPFRLAGLMALALFLSAAAPADWPMWQHDAGHSAASDESLPDHPVLLWTLPLPPLTPCWEDIVNQDRMPFDAQYEPVVAGTTLVVASNRDDSVTAYDTRSGRELWRAFTDGPVRFPPVLHDGRVHAASDDGCLYTWALSDGAPLWRLPGGRDDRRVLGNGRLVSAWCARGGPVLLEQTLYFGAGIWPFMGTYVRAVDARTGASVWTQGNLGELYVKQPHAGSESFGAVTPQGALAAAGDRLVVPNGRALPAVLHRADGSLVHFRLDGSTMHEVGEASDRKLEGGSYVCTDGRYVVNRRGVATALYDAASGDAFIVWKGTHQPVLADGVLYLGGDTLRAFPLASLALKPYEVTVTDKKTGEKKTVARRRWELPPAWELPMASAGALMRSGARLYAAAGGQLTATDLGTTPPRAVWTLTLPGTIVRLLAADQRLFAVTAEGPIHCLGTGPAAPVLPAAAPTPAPTGAADHPFADLVADLALPTGWALVYDAPDPAALAALLTGPGLRLVAVNSDPETVQTLRQHFQARALYGPRVTSHAGTVEAFRVPPYLALLVVVCRVPPAADPAWLQRLYASVRPYGGRLYLAGDPDSLRQLADQAQLPAAVLTARAEGLLITRPGQLPGAAPWTHLYGSAANPAKSDEQLVKAPLGLLWFGGNSHADVLPRHGHGPGEQVIGGRLFIQGIQTLSARDVYTGAVLWKRSFPGLDTAGIYYDSSYCEDPLDLTYNQRHIPGANARGTNFVAAADRVYLLAGKDCFVLDPADGRTLATFTLPPAPPTAAPPAWGYIGVAGDVLLGGTGFSAFSQAYGIEKGEVADDFDASSSRGLAALDRQTGRLLWTRPASLGFRHNAICAAGDTVYCIDALPSIVLDRLKRRGQEATGEPVLLALDLHTGAERWRRTEGVFGTWLGIAAGRGILLQSGRASRDALKDESAERMTALNGTDGTVLWDRKGSFGGPCMLHGDTIYTSATSTTGGAYSVLTGAPVMRAHPLTGRPIPWSYHRRYGCNAVVASEHLLTFRSGAAGFCDLAGDSGTANLGGFKSGCTSNLIAADGVLNAPDYTRTCTCSYQNQTSLALVHMPDLDLWTANDLERGPGRLLDLPLNLGAPGDRRSDTGVLWFDFPAVGGPSPRLPVAIEGEALRWYRQPSAEFSGGEAWVAASGVEGDLRLSVDLLTDEERYRHLRVPVAAAADDAEEVDGAVVHGSGDLELVRDQKEQTVGLRFANLALAPADMIAAAHLWFTTDEASNEVTEVVIRAQLAPSAPPFGKSPGDLTGRALTRTEVRWIIPPWTTAGASSAAQRSPDLAPLLREIVAQPGWAPGQAAAFVISGHGRRVARSADHAGGGAPVLDVSLVKTPAEVAAEPAVPYRLRLVFAEPAAAPSGRAFDVVVQGDTVLSGVRLDGPTRQPVCRELGPLLLRDRLEMELRACPGSAAPPVLCGLHLRAEAGP